MTTTSALLLLADQQRPRTQQREIGMSDLGSCRKRTGFKLAGTEPVNPVGSVQAVIGSAVHDMVAGIMRLVAKPGDLVEHEVEFAGIKGHVDRYEAAEEKVVDTKTTSARWLEHIKLHAPEHSQVWQTSGYGAALIKAGYPVKRIQLDFIARDTGEEYVWSKPFDVADVRAALEWLKLVRETPLDMLPRDYMPDSSFCRGCPFGGMDGGICWENHTPGLGLGTAIYSEHPDAGFWAEELWAARDAQKEPKKSAERAAAALRAVVDPGGRSTKCGDRWLRIDGNNALRFVSGPREAEFNL